LLEAGAGEADQHAALVEPGFELFLGAGDQLADIGQHDGGDALLLDQVVHGGGDVALVRRDDVGIRGQRALDIVERRQQRLRFLAGFAGDDADAVPLRAGIEQIDGAGGALALDLDARHLIADLERQVEARLSLALALLDGEGRFAKRLAASGQSPDRTFARAFNAADDAAGEHAAFAGGMAETQRGVAWLGRKHGEAATIARELRKARGKALAFAVVEAVGQPDDAVAGLDREVLFQRFRELGAVGRVRFRVQADNAFARGIRRHRLADRLIRGGRREHDVAAIAARAVDGRTNGFAARGPLSGGGPAIVDDEKKRPFAGEGFAVGIDDGPGQRQDQQRGQQHAQQGQPPGAARRGLLGGFQVFEEPRRREHHDLRARRREAQQPPDRGQRHERHQDPRLQEAYGAERHHAAPADDDVPREAR
jgi:hypothetical protein